MAPCATSNTPTEEQREKLWDAIQDLDNHFNTPETFSRGLLAYQSYKRYKEHDYQWRRQHGGGGKFNPLLNLYEKILESDKHRFRVFINTPPEDVLRWMQDVVASNAHQATPTQTDRTTPTESQTASSQSSIMQPTGRAAKRKASAQRNPIEKRWVLSTRYFWDVCESCRKEYKRRKCCSTHVKRHLKKTMVDNCCGNDFISIALKKLNLPDSLREFGLPPDVIKLLLELASDHIMKDHVEIISYPSTSSNRSRSASASSNGNAAFQEPMRTSAYVQAAGTVPKFASLGNNEMMAPSDPDISSPRGYMDPVQGPGAYTFGNDPYQDFGYPPTAFTQSTLSAENMYGGSQPQYGVFKSYDPSHDPLSGN